MSPKVLLAICLVGAVPATVGIVLKIIETLAVPPPPAPPPPKCYTVRTESLSNLRSCAYLGTTEAVCDYPEALLKIMRENHMKRCDE